MKISIGVSNRHVHLKKEHLNVLFGEGYELEKKNDLTQPGQYASTALVTIKTEKSQIDNVRVLGPVRNYTQVEISKTDAYKLGLNPPVRNSGDLENSEDITIIGPEGELYKKNVCIIANRHIHLTPEYAEANGIKDNDYVDVEVEGIKPTRFYDVQVRVRDDFNVEMHIDTDDANSAGLKNGSKVTIIRKPKK